MEKSVQAKKRHSLLLQALRDIFCKHIADLFPQVFITITRLDLYEKERVAKVYISFLHNDNPAIASIMDQLNEKQSKIRGLLGNQLARKLRAIPKCSFHLDTALDEAFHVQNLLESFRTSTK